MVTLTLSDNAHSEERASPRKPKVRTEVRSEKEASFDVWCFSAIYDRVSIENRNTSGGNIPMDS